MTSIKQHIKQGFRNYFTLYGNNHLKILDHVLLGNGTGLGWSKAGTLESCLPSRKKERRERSKRVVHVEAIQAISHLPLVTQRRVRRHLNDAMIWAMPEGCEDAQTAWDEWKLGELSLDASMYLNSLVKPAKFHEVFTKSFSPIVRIPGNVQIDYVRAMLEVLLAVLDHPEHSRSNHANAIINLMRLRPMFREFGITITESDVLDRIELRDKRMLELDIKRHLGNHELDESQLSDEEYFEWARLSSHGLRQYEIRLLRRYHQYLRWRDDRDDELRELRDRDARRNKRDFWVNLDIPTRNNIPTEAMQWALGQQSIEKMFAHRKPIALIGQTNGPTK